VGIVVGQKNGPWLANGAVNGGNVQSAPRLTNSQPRAIKYFFITTSHYSNSIFIIPPANEHVNTANPTDKSNRKDELGTTSDSPLTHHAHLAHWRIIFH
jgi:hypothetical protein